MSTVDRILRLPQVREMTGLGTTSIYGLIRTGNFPAQLKLTPRASGWLESQVLAWVKSRRIRDRGTTTCGN